MKWHSSKSPGELKISFNKALCYVSVALHGLLPPEV